MRLIFRRLFGVIVILLYFLGMVTIIPFLIVFVFTGKGPDGVMDWFFDYTEADY